MRCFLRGLFVAAAFFGAGRSATAQTAIKLFDATPYTPSGTLTSPTLARSFGHIDVALSCPAGSTATISSTPDGTGNVLVDNHIRVNGTDVCDGLVSCWLGACDVTCFQKFDIPTTTY